MLDLLFVPDYYIDYDFKGKNIHLNMPNVNDYILLKSISGLTKIQCYNLVKKLLNDNKEELVINLNEVIAEFAPHPDNLAIFICEYIEAVEEICKSEDFVIPHIPELDDDTDDSFVVMSYFEHLTAVYTNMKITELKSLKITDYLRFRRDAVVNGLKQTEKGREYLENVKLVSQTEPDRVALRRIAGKQKGG